MTGLQFTTETIIRNPDGKLAFIGKPDDPRRKLVENINAGHCGQAEIDGLDGLPVFDFAALDPEGENALFVVENVGHCISGSRL